MTALKKSEDRQAYVLRFFSTRKEERLVPLHLDRTRFSRVEKSDLQERAGEPLPLDADGCAVPVKAGEIVRCCKSSLCFMNSFRRSNSALEWSGRNFSSCTN